MDFSDDDSDCVVTWSSEIEPCITQPKKKGKVELEDNFNLVIIPGDGHCIANCFAVHFNTSLDKVLDLLDKEFRENIIKYSDFSEYDDDSILLEVFRYITEKRYDSSTADMFIHAFSSIFKTKVVIKYANDTKEDTVIGSNYCENEISLFKCQDHFDLIIKPSELETTSDGISKPE